jgi:uncharacterized OsmC-like protein
MQRATATRVNNLTHRMTIRQHELTLDEPAAHGGDDRGRVERLRAIAAKCPVHRTLDGPVVFRERVEMTQQAG